MLNIFGANKSDRVECLSNSSGLYGPQQDFRTTLQAKL